MMRDTATATPRVIPHLITTSSTEARSTRPANRSRFNGKIETKKKFTLPEWKIGETDAVVFPFVCLIAGISIFAFIVAVIKGK